MILHQSDWCRPHGIPRPPVLPPDDEHTDALAAIAAAIDGALHFDDATPTVTSIPDTTPQVSGRSLSGGSARVPGPATSAGRPGTRTYSMWAAARI